MKLAISNIAWETSEDKQIAEVLLKHHVHAIEIALTKIKPDISNITKEDLQNYKKWWKEKSISIIALQALLFGRPELTLFDSNEIRQKTLAYLYKVIECADVLEAKILVFGSPKNRRKNNIRSDEATEIASSFFYSLGEKAQKHGVLITVEPNPPQYGADFLTTTDETRQLLLKVNHPGVVLHLDSAILTLNKENISETIMKEKNNLYHFHISEPYLELVGKRVVDHQTINKALANISYERYVSIEMKSQILTSNIEAVNKALEFVRSIYTLSS